MNVKKTLPDEELSRILYDSGLWETKADVDSALSTVYRLNFDVIARDGGTIDEAIASFYLDDLGYIDRVPKHWQEYIDRKKYGRDIRLSDKKGRAVYEIPDASGESGTDWKFYVIRWNRLLS